MKNHHKEIMLTFRCSRPTLNELNKYAKSLKVSRSEFIRTCVGEYLEEMYVKTNREKK